MSFGTNTTRFEEIKRKRRIRPICANCGKRFYRIVSVSQNLNPFNLTEAGTVKTRREIEKELTEALKRECSKMMAAGIIHCG